MLPLIARNHVYWLLNQVKIVVVVRRGGTKIKISVYKILGACIEKRIDVTLVPTLSVTCVTGITYLLFYRRSNLFGSLSLCYHRVQTVASLSGLLTQSFTVLSLPPCLPKGRSKSIREDFYSPDLKTAR